MSKLIPIEEAKKLPVWKEMNRYIKAALKDHFGDTEYEVKAFDTYWEIYVEGRPVASIQVREEDMRPLSEEENNHN
jgi:hypothetical protein